MIDLTPAALQFTNDALLTLGLLFLTICILSGLVWCLGNLRNWMSWQ